MPKAKTILLVKCIRCKHEWYPYKPGRPGKCPGCGDPKWDLPRIRAKRGSAKKPKR